MPSDDKNYESKKDNKSLIDIAQEGLKSNPSALGDPISMKAETSDSEPTDADRPTKTPARETANMATDDPESANASQREPSEEARAGRGAKGAGRGDKRGSEKSKL